MAVEAVIKANCQPSENGQITTSCGSKPPEWIMIQLGICNDDVVDGLNAFLLCSWDCAESETMNRF